MKNIWHAILKDRLVYLHSRYKRWETFEQLDAVIGPRPEKAKLARWYQSRPHGPGNTYWGTLKDQVRERDRLLRLANRPPTLKPPTLKPLSKTALKAAIKKAEDNAFIPPPPRKIRPWSEIELDDQQVKLLQQELAK